MKSLPTRPPIARALAERSFTEPTPVQAAVLAGDALGRDLLVSAQTGSGKTVAYGLAIATDLLGDADRFEEGDKPLALVVAPTRELALQVQRELTWLYQYTGARVVSCVGGMDPRSEARALAEGAHIVVGTPGRLCDHLQRNRLDVSGLKAVVLDEADEMLDLGFREDLESILKTTPETRRTLLFSATLPRGIVALARQFQKDAFRIEVAGGDGGHADIEYRAIRVAAQDVEHAVVNVLRYFESPSTIVFCNTRNAVKHLQAALLERGFSVVALSGELSQSERTHALQSLRDGRARVCVATDVAARGIDLPNLGLVIHADLPSDPEVMQHRSGRTGRAGRKGVSVLLVPPARRRRAELMLDQAGVDATWGTAPQADEIRKLDHQRLLQDSLFTETSTEDDLTLARALLAERSPEDIAAALARMYRARLPSPEDILNPGTDGGRSRDGRGDRRDGSHVRNATSGAERAPREKKTGFRRPMEGGSVWFRAAIGRQKNAEARWLLPMICRRGGLNKNDIGAIRIYDAHTEFEIAGTAAEEFSLKIKRADKENIRIEPMQAGTQGQTPAGSSVDQAANAGATHDTNVRQDDKPVDHSGLKNEPKNEPKSAPKGELRNDPNKRYGGPRFGDKRHGDKRHGEPSGERPHKFNKKRGFDKKKRPDNRPAHAGQPPSGQPPREGAAPFANRPFGKKPNKKKYRG